VPFHRAVSPCRIKALFPGCGAACNAASLIRGRHNLGI
jgi:hypothetical protein